MREGGQTVCTRELGRSRFFPNSDDRAVGYKRTFEEESFELCRRNLRHGRQHDLQLEEGERRLTWNPEYLINSFVRSTIV